ncbi:hypothetical protein J8273_0577 [Carpediemonas membranifera]|nr:hypothetical protein J8273_0577 [Carpediemonas membranifera]|eukprot:KAG9395337.1 hypothetical protein J8273_0577 [Carpediemonas membranifera]
MNRARMWRAKMFPPGKSEVRLSEAQEHQFFRICLDSYRSFRESYDKLYNLPYTEQSLATTVSSFFEWAEELVKLAKDGLEPTPTAPAKKVDPRPKSSAVKTKMTRSGSASAVGRTSMRSADLKRRERPMSSKHRVEIPVVDHSRDGEINARISHLLRQNAILTRNVHTLEASRLEMIEGAAGMRKAIAAFEERQNAAELAVKITNLGLAVDAFMRTKSTAQAVEPEPIPEQPSQLESAGVAEFMDDLAKVMPGLAQFNANMRRNAGDDEIVATDDDLALLQDIQNGLIRVENAGRDVLAKFD